MTRPHTLGHGIGVAGGLTRWMTLPPSVKGSCRWCKGPVPRGRRTWCSDACVGEYMIRASGSKVRAEVRRRDHGVCALCGLDCERIAARIRAEVVRIRAYRWRLGLEAAPPHPWNPLAGGWWRWNPRSSGVLVDGRRYFVHPSDTLLQADHIVPVTEGGGACGLDNYRTLCRWCHARATGKLRRRLNAAKRNGAAE